MSDEETTQKPTSRLSGGLIAGAIVAVALLVFVVQNTEETTVEWLLFESDSTPVWLVIVIAAIAGAVVSELVGWLIRRRRRG